MPPPVFPAQPFPAQPSPTEPARRAFSLRQARTVQRLADAAVEELRTSGYDGLTVRNVARRAGMAPATAYTYFTSKDHLVTEVFWRRFHSSPEAGVDKRCGAATRVSAVLSQFALLVADEPDVASACTVAMLSGDPEVTLLRARIGAELHRRLGVALGPKADPGVLRTLELAMWGAMVQAGVGHLAYTDLPAMLEEVAHTVLRRKR